jgi:hypothetical protein
MKLDTKAEIIVQGLSRGSLEGLEGLKSGFDLRIKAYQRRPTPTPE